MDRKQIHLLLNIRKYFSNFKSSNYEPQYDSLFYLATYSNFIGSYILRKLARTKSLSFFNNFSIVIKDIFFSLNYLNFSLSKKKIQNDYNQIIVTWAFENNFDKRGNLIDRYLNISSNKLKKTLWFVIYMSEKLPKKFNNNIILLKKNNKKSLNFFAIFKFIFKNVKFIFKNFFYFLSSISNYNFFSFTLISNLKVFLNSKIKYLIMPYEAQPFQNNIIAFLKNHHYKIKTIGYIHSPPLALPSNFVYKSFSPDKIILNGKDQIYCFSKILGWKKSKIKLLPSLRFLKTKKNIVKTIYLPLSIRNPKIVLKSLNFLIENNYIDIKNYLIKNHPAAFKSTKNLKLKKSIEKLKENLKKNNEKINSKYLIFIGSSGGIIEALERGSKVIQIVEFPLFDIYSNRIWPSIIRRKVNENIYIYSLRKKGNLIKLGNKKNVRLNMNNL